MRTTPRSLLSFSVFPSYFVMFPAIGKTWKYRTVLSAEISKSSLKNRHKSLKFHITENDAVNEHFIIIFPLSNTSSPANCEMWDVRCTLCHNVNLCKWKLNWVNRLQNTLTSRCFTLTYFHDDILVRKYNTLEFHNSKAYKRISSGTRASQTLCKWLKVDFSNTGTHVALVF